MEYEIKTLDCIYDETDFNRKLPVGLPLAVGQLTTNKYYAIMIEREEAYICDEDLNPYFKAYMATTSLSEHVRIMDKLRQFLGGNVHTGDDWRKNKEIFKVLAPQVTHIIETQRPEYSGYLPRLRYSLDDIYNLDVEQQVEQLLFNFRDFTYSHKKPRQYKIVDRNEVPANFIHLTTIRDGGTEIRVDPKNKTAIAILPDTLMYSKLGDIAVIIDAPSKQLDLTDFNAVYRELSRWADDDYRAAMKKK